jgi:predicted RNA binding protein YcfA (HicA-like mRNA interferase family)
MALQVDRRTMERWLLTHGFELLPGKKTSHRQYRRAAVTVTLPGHGPQDLTKKHVAIIIRALVRAGGDREALRRELGWAP